MEILSQSNAQGYKLQGLKFELEIEASILSLVVLYNELRKGLNRVDVCI